MPSRPGDPLGSSSSGSPSGFRSPALRQAALLLQEGLPAGRGAWQSGHTAAETGAGGTGGSSPRGAALLGTVLL